MSDDRLEQTLIERLPEVREEALKWAWSAAATEPTAALVAQYPEVRKAVLRSLAASVTDPEIVGMFKAWQAQRVAALTDEQLRKMPYSPRDTVQVVRAWLMATLGEP